MRTVLFLLFSFFSAASFAQSGKNKLSTADSSKPIQVVDVACGSCKFGMKGKGCTLAVKINDKPYFVDGASIDNYGDAHAKDGLCNKVRRAEVQGKVVKDKYKVTYFKLLPDQ
ncbi:MAG: DUF6370 family protein [Ferruginibacter sp.]